MPLLGRRVNLLLHLSTLRECGAQITGMSPDSHFFFWCLPVLARATAPHAPVLSLSAVSER